MLTESTHASSSERQPRVRLASIDVFRGITVAGMLLVNNPGNSANVYSPLRHSEWHGWTPADLVFPFFLILVGVTTQLSLAHRAATGDSPASVHRAIFRRAAIIFLLGLFINAYPFYNGSAIAGPDWLPAIMGHVVARFEGLRIPGVLQRIGICYLIASLVSWKSSSIRVVYAVAALLIGYWAIVTLLPVPGESALGMQLLNEPARTLPAWVDRTLLDWTRWGMGNHLWEGSVTYDPEGVLSTIPSIATVLLGVLAARWLQADRALSERLSALAAVGALLMVSASVWTWSLPINKPIWTSSYVLFTAGAAFLILSAIGWLIEVRQWKGWSKPFLVFGTNALLAYVGSELLAKIFHSSIKVKFDGHRVATETAVTRLFELIGVDQRAASLLWAMIFVSICFAMLKPLYNRGKFWRV